MQGFYDWYTPKALADNAGPASDIALKSKSSVFGTKLLKALREDSAAAAKAKGEIVGLDFDPFLNSQDPDSHYSVGKITRKGESYYVSVHSVSSGKLSAKADVIAKLEMHGGTWRFTNFIYLNGPNLLSLLYDLKRDRVRHF